MDRTMKAAIAVIVVSVVAIFIMAPAGSGAGFVQKTQAAQSDSQQQGSLAIAQPGNSPGPGPGSTADTGATRTFTLGVTGTQYSPAEIRVRLGTKIRIEGDPSTLVGCMSTVDIDGYGISKRIQAGDNVIEFTADKPGTYPIHCNMGMGNGRLVVEDSSGGVPVQSQAPAIARGTGGCCP